ncbi:HAD hydrolase-like protein [Alicyclobacillus dauci]|uniref:HAD hydrolase-like protein n=1 Tax=Alicyclobacillus dauci TaxID=1475485 RepID=UPI003899525F
MVGRTEAVYPIPGAIETVVEKRASGVKLALITNGATVPQREKIERFGLGERFDCVLIGGECGYGGYQESESQRCREYGKSPCRQLENNL